MIFNQILPMLEKIAVILILLSLIGCQPLKKAPINDPINNNPPTFIWPEDVPNVELWLNANLNIKAAIQWSSFTFFNKPFKHWNKDIKIAFFRRFIQRWRNQPTGLDDPPKNIANNVGNTGFVRMSLSELDARDLYLSYLANSLVLEMRNELPWSIKNYNKEQLTTLLDGNYLFERKLDKTYRIKRGWSFPAPPDVARSFMQDKIKENTLSTIVATIKWCRRMIHFSGSLNVNGAKRQWQYVGLVPVSRIISGTPFTGKDDVVKHRTAGCWGTTGFLISVLHSVNIPVIQKVGGRHSLPYFPTEGKFLSHGDDPYNAFVRTADYPAEKLLVDISLFDPWYRADDMPNRSINVGRRPRELALTHLPKYLLGLYCQDKKDNTTKEQGKVIKALRHWTVEGLEAKTLWQRMDAKLAQSGGCN